MSGSLSFPNFGGAIDTPIGPVILQPFRALGTIIPDCVIEERHSDRLRITDHPVETGVVMSDHAFMLPLELTLRYGWSNAILPSTLGGIASSIEKFGTGEFNVQIVYEALRNLQAQRIPFTVITGKRVYPNMMLIEELEVTTDQHSEYTLMVNIHCREVIIVSTQAATLTAPGGDHAQPENTAPATDRGPVQATPSANQTPLLSQGFGAAVAGTAPGGGGLG